jgi:predicted transcriptional regulator
MKLKDIVKTVLNENDNIEFISKEYQELLQQKNKMMKDFKHVYDNERDETKRFDYLLKFIEHSAKIDKELAKEQSKYMTTLQNIK